MEIESKLARMGMPVPDLADDSDLGAVPTMLPGFLDPAITAAAPIDRWRADTRRSRTSARNQSIGQRRSVHLPHVGAVTDLPYASDDDDTSEVIDLRDRRPDPHEGRSWLTRRRTRT